MADALDTQGKVVAMTGIRAEIDYLQLTTSTFIGVGDLLAKTGIGNFAVSGVTGELTNTSSFVFTINAADIGQTATAVQILDGDENVLMILDLDTALTVNYAGEATIAIGDLKATL